MQKLVAMVHGKRGFIRPLFNGVATLISDGKCINTEVLSKKQCEQCEQWNHRKDTVEYSSLKEKHICAINHTGSGAVAMEKLQV